MTTTVHLVRHVPHEHQGRIHVGRMEGVRLAPRSRERLRFLTERFNGVELAAVYASPVSRAQETAHAIADPAGLEIRTRPDLNELDAGEWTGKSFDEIGLDPRARLWNDARSLARVPGGESMLEVQFRMVRWLEEARAAHPEATVVAVSHGDPIKALVLYALGASLDFYGRIEPEPGSTCTLEVGDWGAKLIRLNETLPE
ncbi:MAG: histidine phosphatase family protein [Pseudomonadota bacterium]|nr:histidine phosphatase family protein [Pseudomonadota bacterium]